MAGSFSSDKNLDEMFYTASKPPIQTVIVNYAWKDVTWKPSAGLNGRKLVMDRLVGSERKAKL